MKKSIQIILPMAMTALWSCIASAQPLNNNFPVKIKTPPPLCEINNHPVVCGEVHDINSETSMKVTYNGHSYVIQPIKPTGQQSQGTLAAYILSDGKGISSTFTTSSNCKIKNEKIGTNMRLKIISEDGQACEIDIK